MAVTVMTHLPTGKNSIKHPRPHECRDHRSLESFDLETGGGRD
jgi:hypothetical protein